MTTTTLVLAALAASSGCSVAATVLALEPDDKFYRSQNEQRTHLGAERTVQVIISTPGYLDLGCTIFERPVYNVHSTRSRWGTFEKVLMGSVVVFEGIFGPGTYFKKEDDPAKSRNNKILGGVLMTDGLATLVLAIALPYHEWEGNSLDKPDPWVVVESRTCPEGTAIEYGGRSFAVQAGGRLAPDAEQWLVDQLITRGGGIRVTATGADLGRIREQSGGQLSAEGRCGLARAVNHPAAAMLCPPVPVVVEPALAPGSDAILLRPPALKLRIDFGVQGRPAR